MILSELIKFIFGFVQIPAISNGIVITFIGWFFYRLLDLGSLRQQFSQSLKDIEQLKVGISDLGKQMDKLKTHLYTVEAHLYIVKTHLVSATGLDIGLFGPGSPLKLLAGGLKLLKASGFKEVFQSNREWFKAEIKKYPITTLAEIDEASMKVLEWCAAQGKFLNFKEIAFENGVELELLLRVIAIYLRDEMADLSD